MCVKERIVERERKREGKKVSKHLSFCFSPICLHIKLHTGKKEMAKDY